MRLFFGLNFIILLLAAPVPHSVGQVQERIKQNNLELAEEWAMETSLLPDRLPERWAARQTRISLNSAHVLDGLLYEEHIEEIGVQEGEIAYTCACLGGWKRELARSTPNLDLCVRMFDNGSLKLVKPSSEDWQTVKAFGNYGGYPSTQPYNWCLGLLNSAKSGAMQRKDYLSTFFFGPIRKPLAAWRNKEGNLVYFWGRPTKPNSQDPPYALRVVFNQDTHLIDQYALVFVEKGVNEENLQKQDYRFVEQGEVEWKKVSVKSKDEKTKTQLRELYVPVRVRIISVMNEGQEMECVNHIQWLFGDDVPDSALIDPRSKEFQEPLFPPLDLEQSAAR